MSEGANNRECWLSAVRQQGMRLAEAPEAYKNDHEIVLAAVTQNGQHRTKDPPDKKLHSICASSCARMI
eukprot:2916063-Amphidinium_carterae.1